MTEHFSASEVAMFVRALQQFGVTCEEAAEGLRTAGDIADSALAGVPFVDEMEWYEDANPWDAHTVSFGDTLERIDGTLSLHEQTTGCHCRQEPDIVMSICDQCAFQEGNTDG